MALVCKESFANPICQSAFKCIDTSCSTSTRMCIIEGTKNNLNSNFVQTQYPILYIYLLHISFWNLYKIFVSWTYDKWLIIAPSIFPDSVVDFFPYQWSLWCAKNVFLTRLTERLQLHSCIFRYKYASFHYWRN